MQRLQLLTITIIVTLFGIMGCINPKANQANNEVVDSDTMVTPVDTISNPISDSLTAIQNNLPPRVHGIDISRYQGNELDFLIAKKDTLGFVIVKATEGNTYVDPKFAHNWGEIRKQGFIRGAYHFYRSNDAAETQLAHFAKVIVDLQAYDLPPIVDFEEGSIVKGGTAAQIETDLLRFMKALEAKFNRTPILYTDVETANRYIKNPSFLAYPLWIANYRKGEQPELPTLWKDEGWTFWQKSQSYDINGTANDCDVFNGNQLELLQLIKDK